ncbi:MAG: pilus assembly protein [Phycisphaerae bacterium]|nr:pilus assembly protein [Phycisphaerae bacterium]
MLILKNNPQSAIRNPQSTGTATVEFVMAIPLLALIIAGTFFFGWLMRNHLRLRAADRYAAWRSVEDTPPSGAEIDEEFFDGRAEGTHLEGDSGSDETLQAFIVAARNQSADADELAENLVARHHVPRARGQKIKTKFTTSVEFWQKMAPGMMDSRHVREGRDWVRGEVNLGGSLRELYFSDIEQSVEDVAGENISQSLQNLFQNGW